MLPDSPNLALKANIVMPLMFPNYSLVFLDQCLLAKFKMMTFGVKFERRVLRARRMSAVYNLKQTLNSCILRNTYTKIGTIQRRLAWPLSKDDTQNREAFHIFLSYATLREGLDVSDLDVVHYFQSVLKLR